MSSPRAIPQLTRTEDAWLVEIPAGYGQCQCYRFLSESQARRFLGLFTERDSKGRPLSQRGTSPSPASAGQR